MLITGRRSGCNRLLLAALRFTARFYWATSLSSLQAAGLARVAPAKTPELLEFGMTHAAGLAASRRFGAEDT